MSFSEEDMNSALVQAEFGLEEGEEKEAEGFTWSADLQAKMAALPLKQSNVIIKLVIAEQQGHKLTRMLHGSYSCKWCGVCSKTKATHATHMKRCVRRDMGEWVFIVPKQTFESWKKSSPEFRACLEQARSEAASFVLRTSLRRLQFATDAAVDELWRQVEQGRDEGNRQRAAIAILDRAGIETAAKNSGQPQQLRLWFDNLQRAGEEEEQGSKGAGE